MAQPANERRAWWFAGLTILCWSTVATAFKLSLQHTDFISLVFWATLISTLVLWGLVGLTGRRAALAAWTFADMRRSAVLGAFNPVIYYLLLFKAYELLPAQQAQVLNFIWPVMLVLLSTLFFRERVSVLAWAALLLSFFGVVVIATQGQIFSVQWTVVSPIGVVLALLSSVFWAAYWLLTRQDTRDPLLRLAVNFSFGSVGIILLILGLWLAGAYAASALWLSRPAMLGAVYVAFFEMSLAFYFWLSALNSARHTASLGNLVFITPFLSLWVISQVLGERLLPGTLLGLILILAGIVLQRWVDRRQALVR